MTNSIGALELSMMPYHCHYCDMWHQGICDRIKSIEYHLDGTIKKVEFKDNGVRS